MITKEDITVKVQTISQKLLQNLSGASDYPRLTVYLPNRKSPEQSNQNEIRLRQSIKEAESLLQNADLSKEDIASYLAPLHHTMEHSNLMLKPSGSMAFFIEREYHTAVELKQPVNEQVMLSNRFFLKPAIIEIQDSNPFYLLALARANTNLYYGGSGGLELVDIQNLPHGIVDVTKFDDPEQSLQGHAGATRSAEGHPGTTPDRITHGQNVQQEQKNNQNERFIATVTKAVDGYLQEKKLPLIILGDEYNVGHFMSHTKLPPKRIHTIYHNVDGKTLQAMHTDALNVLRKKSSEDCSQIEQRVKESARNHICKDLEEIAIGAGTGRVEVALLDKSSGTIAICEPKKNDFRIVDDRMELGAHPVDDLIAQETLKHGGQIRFLPKSEMPYPEAKAIAIMRF